MSASIAPALGAAIHDVASMTLIPESGATICDNLGRDVARAAVGDAPTMSESMRRRLSE